MERKPYDFVVVGGGAVGLSTALELSKEYRGAVLEKESEIATHQTGHNSGVIHSGINYPAGSDKARLCVEGRTLLLEYLEQKGIPYKVSGKVMVAKTEEESERLNSYYQQGLQNGISEQELKIIDGDQLREIEPHSQGFAALWVGTTGVVDYSQVARFYALDFQQNGGKILSGTKLVGIKQQDNLTYLETTTGTYRTRLLINCGGLYADMIALMAGIIPSIRIIPVRGEFYSLTDVSSYLVNNSINPLPIPNLPFVDIHLTRTIDDQVKVGPNAVLAFAKEGYGKRDINPREMLLYTLLLIPTFYRMCWRYWRVGRDEFIRSFSKKIFTQSVQKLVPEIEEKDLEYYGAGVRAQAVSSDGSLVNDFVFEWSKDGKSLHVLNAPSPAATASLAIGRYIAQRARSALE
ncbi:L-2-hydroxyglutarate oxidase [Candidatus Daviesbacteria bacterium]|nr:L-2-hydroxyglutarate oxidase [Candidatus Daviesbacteria bacterium]